MQFLWNRFVSHRIWVLHMFSLVSFISNKSVILRDKLVKLFKIIEENNNIEELNCSPLEGHTYSINHVEFSHDGTMLATCSLDGGTIIWNPEVCVIFCVVNSFKGLLLIRLEKCLEAYRKTV